MNKDQIRKFIDTITLEVVKLGEIAIKEQGHVINLGKEHKDDDSDDERIIERGRAKTEIDEKVQELLLGSIKELLGTDKVKIDAEEDTPTKQLYDCVNPSITVVIDPIDGTLEYVSGSDRYSINIGILENGIVLATIVYFPKFKRMYLLDENKIPFLISFSEDLNIISRDQLISPPHINQATVYTNNRVSKEIISKLQEKGITVIEDDGKVLWPDAILKCISGDYTTSIFHSPQIRDVLLGAIIQNISRGYMKDWNGNDVKWPNEGRIPKVIFGVGELPESIISSLKD